MRSFSTVVVISTFGVIALVGLIVLAATGNLDDATRTALVSVTTASLAGAAGVALPAAPNPAATSLADRLGGYLETLAGPASSPTSSSSPAVVDVAEPTSLASGAAE